MYRNLMAEIARAKISQTDIAHQLGITPTTLSFKLNGKSSLTLDECVKIKKILGVNESVEYLFATDQNNRRRRECRQ